MWQRPSKSVKPSNDTIPQSSYRDASESWRELMLPDDMTRSVSAPRVLLIDDDPNFGKIMTRAAAVSGIKLQFCKSLDEFAKLQSREYDVIVLDYDLGAVTGCELARYLESMDPREIPVVLVSQTKMRGSNKWPGSIREFVHKGLGPFAILDAAFEAHDATCVHRAIGSKKTLN